MTATVQDGYRAIATAMFAGFEASGRARRAGRALIARTERLLGEAGQPPLSESSVEVIGGGDLPGTPRRDDTGLEAVLKVGARHPDRSALEIFAQEFIPFGLVAQGMTGVFAGRPRVAPVFRVFHLLAKKAATPVRVHLGEETIEGGGSRPALPTRSSPPRRTPTAPTKRCRPTRTSRCRSSASPGLVAATRATARTSA